MAIVEPTPMDTKYQLVRDKLIDRLDYVLGRMHDSDYNSFDIVVPYLERVILETILTELGLCYHNVDDLYDHNPLDYNTVQLNPRRFAWLFKLFRLFPYKKITINHQPPPEEAISTYAIGYTEYDLAMHEDER